MKRIAFTLVLLLAIFVSLVDGMQVVKTAEANPYPYANCDSSFVTVSVVSPENTTYDSNSILLNITVGAYPGIFFVGYFLDGGPFIQVAPDKWDAHTFSESVWLNELSKGSHCIIVEAGAPETPNNIVSDSSQIYFTITRDFVPEPTSTTPPPTPTRGIQTREFEDFIIGIIAGAVAIAVLVLLYYLTKRKIH